MIASETIEQVAQLEDEVPARVEHAAAVDARRSASARAQLGQLGRSPRRGPPRPGRCRRGAASPPGGRAGWRTGPRPSARARAAPRAPRAASRTWTGIDVRLVRPGRPRAPPRRRPVRAPNTSRSDSELPPRRFAPCMPAGDLAGGEQARDGRGAGLGVDPDAAHHVVGRRARPPSGPSVMSTSASSLNWSYIDGSLRRTCSAGR